MPDPKLDGALDTIHELTTRRDDTLAWLDLYIEQDPDRAQLYWFLIDTLTEQPHGCDARIPVG